MRGSHPDYPLLAGVALLLLFGLVVLSSASVVEAQEDFGSGIGYLVRQLGYGVGVGLVGFFIASRIPYQRLRPLAPLFLIGALVLLILVFLPGIGVALGGARRWVQLGLLRFQPAEVAKLGFILYFAGWFEARERHLHKFWEGLGPFLLLVGVFGALLLLQPNLGTFGILALTALAMLFLAGGRFTHLAAIIAAGVGLLLLAIRLAPYRLNRLLAFLNPSADPQGIGYQINQALLAIGSGGLFGRGLGHSVQKFNYLPEAVGDSIFAILVEELGLVGGAFLIALFLFIGYRGFKIAKGAPDSFGRLLAGGITSWILIQAFVNIAAISGLIPLTGVPLPFVSYGGTSLAVLLTGVGILVNVSKYARK